MTTCPRCAGRVFREHDHYGDRLACIACGWSQDCAPDGSPLPALELSREPPVPRDREATHERRAASQRNVWERRWTEGRR